MEKWAGGSRNLLRRQNRQRPDAIIELAALLVACGHWLSLSLLDMAVTATLFVLGEIVLSRFFFAMGLRDRPY